MASISSVVTMGYGTGSFAGDVNLLPTLGYGVGVETFAVPTPYRPRYQNPETPTRHRIAGSSDSRLRIPASPSDSRYRMPSEDVL